MDSEQRFWKVTLSIKIISREENVILRESRLAFRNSLSRKRVTMNPKSSIKIEYTEGPMLGEKIIELRENLDIMVRVRWNVRMKGIAGIFSGSSPRITLERELSRLLKESKLNAKQV